VSREESGRVCRAARESRLKCRREVRAGHSHSAAYTVQSTTRRRYSAGADKPARDWPERTNNVSETAITLH